MDDHSDLIQRLLVGLISDREIIAGHICIPVDQAVSVTNEAAAALREKQAEIERLREALEIYADPCDAPDKGPCQYEGNMCCMTARAALGKDGA